MHDNLDDLLKRYRMTFAEGDSNGVNVLYGLKDLIDEHYKPDFTMVEVGSFAGVSTELFARMCKKVYSVDPYEPYSEVPTNYLLEAEVAMGELVKKYSNITHIKKTSANAGNDFDDCSLDAVYIDASHEAHAVMNDISVWLPKIKNEGILSGHDGNSVIISVVRSFFPNETIYQYSDSSWAVVVKKD